MRRSSKNVYPKRNEGENGLPLVGQKHGAWFGEQYIIMEATLCPIMLPHCTLLPTLLSCVCPYLASLPCRSVGYSPLLQSVSASLMDGCSSVWYCLDEVMDAPLPSLAAWSQNTELLVKR